MSLSLFDKFLSPSEVSEATGRALSAVYKSARTWGGGRKKRTRGKEYPISSMPAHYQGPCAEYWQRKEVDRLAGLASEVQSKIDYENPPSPVDYSDMSSPPSSGTVVRHPANIEPVDPTAPVLNEVRPTPSPGRQRQREARRRRQARHRPEDRVAVPEVRNPEGPREGPEPEGRDEAGGGSPTPLQRPPPHEAPRCPRWLHVEGVGSQRRSRLREVLLRLP